LYRIIGFWSTGIAEGSIQGNYALYDILSALEWIKANVRSFGGDPGLVSLMGHGHGAALVHLLAISPLTAGYYFCLLNTHSEMRFRNARNTNIQNDKLSLNVSDN